MTAINTSLPRTPITLAEYKALPEGPPKHEFENGELITMPQPTPEHQDVVGVLRYALRAHVRRNKLGRAFMEPDLYLPDGPGYVPDIVFLATERLALYDEEDKSIHGSPDLCVEVLSTHPSRDRVDKFRVYSENKVPWYWLVDPIDLSVEEYRLTAEGYLRSASVPAGEAFTPALFPGFTVDLKKLMEANGPAASA
jgi:Uma2 family endonuclease